MYKCISGDCMKKVLRIFLLAFLALIVIVGGYASYLTFNYYRIEDNKVNNIDNNDGLQTIKVDTEYSILTYNIGFGAYSQDFSFFMDGGKDSKAKSKKDVIKNTNGVITTLQEKNPDFILLQEVDVDSTRSYHVNQDRSIYKKFEGYAHAFSTNFHSGFLFYPIFDPHGSVESGLSFMSKYKIESSVRRSLPVDNGWPTKFFDLDRAMQVNRFNIEESTKQLVIINAHFSAYDEGGIIRKKQFNMLNAILKEEKAKGNYVIVGGDFNHDLLNEEKSSFTNQPTPDWVQVFPETDLNDGYSVVKVDNAPTVRSTDIAYDSKSIGKDKKNYFAVIDGFIKSDNIEISLKENINLEFMNSDHNPVYVKFILK